MSEHWTDSELPPKECERLFEKVEEALRLLSAMLDRMDRRMQEADTEARSIRSKKSSASWKALVSFVALVLEQKNWVEAMNKDVSVIIKEIGNIKDIKNLPRPTGPGAIAVPSTEVLVSIQRAKDVLASAPQRLESLCRKAIIKMAVCLRPPESVMAEDLGYRSRPGKSVKGGGGRTLGASSWYAHPLALLIKLTVQDQDAESARFRARYEQLPPAPEHIDAAEWGEEGAASEWLLESETGTPDRLQDQETRMEAASESTLFHERKRPEPFSGERYDHALALIRSGNTEPAGPVLGVRFSVNDKDLIVIGKVGGKKCSVVVTRRMFRDRI